MNLLEQKIEQLSTVDIGHYDSNFATELLTYDSNVRDALNGLIDLYERAGFLYPEKKKRISPYVDLILDNWEAALKLDDRLINIIRFKGKSKKKRTTDINNLLANHL